MSAVACTAIKLCSSHTMLRYALLFLSCEAVNPNAKCNCHSPYHAHILFLPVGNFTLAASSHHFSHGSSQFTMLFLHSNIRSVRPDFTAWQTFPKTHVAPEPQETAWQPGWWSALETHYAVRLPHKPWLSHWHC